MRDNRSDKRGAVRLDLEGEVFSRVEDWRRQQSVIPSRKEAVLQLVERALAAAQQRRSAAA